MSTRGRVRPGGTLAIPLLGDYPIANKRPPDVARELEARLAPFVTQPHVNVAIEESPTQVTTIGEVRNPGRRALESPATVMDALADAGGLTEFADDDRIFVLRRGDRIRFTFDELSRGNGRARAFQMQTGDVIVVE
jgi:polysaccharide export outer membrane protein